jgi:hypothetical protein
VISQQNQALRIAEWERTQQDAFNEREDSRGGAYAESQSEDDCQGKAGRFSQLAKGKAEILFE